MVCILATVHKWIPSKVDPETPGNVAHANNYSHGRKHYSWKKKMGVVWIFSQTSITNSPVLRHQLPSRNSIQFWHYLELRAQSHKTVSTSHTSYKSRVSKLSTLLSNLATNLGVSIIPSIGETEKCWDWCSTQEITWLSSLL